VKGFTILEPPADVVGRADDQIHREWRWTFQANPDRLTVLVTGRHYDEQVHITIRVRSAVRPGTEQNDLVGLEPLTNLAGIPSDHGHGDVRPIVASARAIGQ
jgi:hypothetical protein